MADSTRTSPNGTVVPGPRRTAAGDERWFGTLVAHSSDLIAVVDEQAHVVYANTVAERMLGFVPEEQFGRDMFELVHPDDLEAVATKFAEVTRSPGTHSPAVFRFQSSSGQWRVLEVTATNCLNDPDISGIVLNAHDVTDRPSSPAPSAR